MEAVIASGGKQYRVAPGQVIEVERLGLDRGRSVEFRDVRLVKADDDRVLVGPEALSGARVTGQIVREAPGRKVLVVKFKRRKRYRRKVGHRQIRTAVRITGIEV
jgi:large subunit ribosomal protein L21